MKTTIFTSILAFLFLVVTMNTTAEGIDSSSVTMNPVKSSVNKNTNFAFRLDVIQIIKASESIDLSELNLVKQKTKVSKNSKTPSFAFKLDPTQIITEAQNPDTGELESK
ncbi:MAG: hypothetical protein HXX13_15665 [Bacteroidetes bacterium]|nr:hypothetical protein [Bacteroidota bacterium]